MNTVVLVKSVVDEAELRADADGHPILKGAATKVSDFDRIGMEEAVALKEQNGGTIIVLSIGSEDAKKSIREAMAIGGTRGAHVVAEPGEDPDALGTAYLLAKAIKRIGQVDLVVCSEGASDSYQGQVGAMVAEFLDYPFLAYGKNVTSDHGNVRCEQAFEGGLRVIEAKMPAVVSMVAGANKPRYPTLIQVIVAGKKLIEDIPLSSLKGTDYPQTGMAVFDVTLEHADRKRVRFDGPAEETAQKLLEALKHEGAI